MSNKVVILGTRLKEEFPELGVKLTPGVPMKVKVWESKFDRDINDKVRFEGEEWVVISCGFNNKKDARECLDGMIGEWVNKGYWEGRKTSKTQF